MKFLRNNVVKIGSVKLLHFQVKDFVHLIVNAVVEWLVLGVLSVFAYIFCNGNLIFWVLIFNFKMLCQWLFPHFKYNNSIFNS